ncbi:histidinol-phosphate transaminase [Eubacterium sp. MSJ-13]|uniref:histidinol-phosphate transaminase n=1 Tax=Eubacterium sp. MSJ-13 TaxID=2841513 RepID=UPI001C124885|nr:histidinol-phosphate transaminase [Eubacterium sp. MSJ-13]MBU5478452.1 histidinol-phosphate transaminase [Eubacterium sp. MSJ-13]
MSSWKDNLRTIDPYVPGEQPQLKDMIKLNTNENPYPPSPKVKEALEKFELDTLRLYPDPDSALLVEAIAKRYGVENDQVFVGVGSDDVLAIAFMTFFNSKKPILFPDITYSFYDVWATLFNIPFERPALDDDFNLVAADYYKQNGGVVIANPNAPTGIRQDESFLRDVIEHNRDVVVIIDEAYVDFSGESALFLTKEYDNVLVVQTFSKSRSMAGMRIGYAMGNPELIKAMNDVRFSYNSYPMTRLSVALGVAAIEDEDYFQKTTKQIIETREWTKKKLTELGFTFGDSKTNFIFVKHETEDAEDIFEKLREKHIFVRHFTSERIRNYLRISIGTQEEMETFIEELKNIL